MLGTTKFKQEKLKFNPKLLKSPARVTAHDSSQITSHFQKRPSFTKEESSKLDVTVDGSKKGRAKSLPPDQFRDASQSIIVVDPNITCITKARREKKKV